MAKPTKEQLDRILGNSQQWAKLPYTPMQSPSGLGIDYLKNRYQEVTTPQPAKPMTKQEAMDFALMGGVTKNIVKTFNGKNLNKPLLDKFIKENKLTPDEYAIYEDNARKMADERLHNINQANAKSNPYYDKYKSQFNIDAWRGMDKDVKSFDPTVGTGARSDTGVWTVDNPYNASTYAGKLDGGVVYPLKLRNYQLASVDVNKNNWNRIPLSDNPVKDTIIRNSDNTDYGLSEYLGDRSVFDDFASTNDVARIAKENKSNRGIQFQDVRDIGSSPQGVNLNKIDEFANVYTMFDPSSIRSIFASFDPLRYKSKDMLAGVGVGVPTAGLLDEKKKKK